MGKINEIQQETKQSFGSNSFTTKIEDNRVVFDSTKDSFRFNDPVDVPALTINGQPVEPGGGSEVEIQDLVEPSERAYKIATIKVDGVDNDIYMTDKYNGSLTVASGNSPLTRYAFLTGGGASNPGLTLRNGSTDDIAQYGITGIGFGSNKKLLFPTITQEETIAIRSDFASNLKNGSAEGSVRNIFAEEESDDYSIGDYATAIGHSCKASGDFSFSEGLSNVSSNTYAHTEGTQNTASGSYSHCEGSQNIASGAGSHCEGIGNEGTSVASHCQNVSNIASGYASSAAGASNISKNKCQFVFGEFNIADPNEGGAYSRGNYVEIVGNGTEEESRSNARTLDWSGNEAIAGTLKIGSTSSTGGAILKVESNSLKISFDNGSTWQTVTLS